MNPTDSIAMYFSPGRELVKDSRVTFDYISGHEASHEHCVRPRDFRMDSVRHFLDLAGIIGGGSPRGWRWLPVSAYRARHSGKSSRAYQAVSYPGFPDPR